jgi:hypothetical protein
MPTFGRRSGRRIVAALVPSHRRFLMSRRVIAVLSLALVSLSLSACSDVTAPTSQRSVQPTGASAASITCKGGSLDSSGRC